MVVSGVRQLKLLKQPDTCVLRLLYKTVVNRRQYKLLLREPMALGRKYEAIKVFWMMKNLGGYIKKKVARIEIQPPF